MNTSCPYNNIEDSSLRCPGELEVACEEVSNGDGVWFQTGLAFWLPVGDDNKVRCSEGCEITTEDVVKVEEQFAKDYYNS